MKNYLIAFATTTLVCLSNFALHAQNTQKQIAVYFDASADSLDTQSKIRLDSFAQLAKNSSNTELLITAYTDDRGNENTNKALANRRANSVLAYFSQHNIATRQENVAAKGELALNTDNNLDIDAQRRQNRRVEIQLVSFVAQNLTEFYDYQARKNTQVFNIDNRKSEYITGKKETSLVIPADAFVRKSDKSAPTPPIKIELREAYTFGDMILQNLTTYSDKNILQTGGMVFIAATDAKGNELQLKTGKTIALNMPHTKVALDSMQIFLSDRAGDHNDVPTDWVATNQPFTNSWGNGGIPNNRNINSNNNTYFNYAESILRTKYKETDIKTRRLAFPKNPIAIPTPFTKSEPKPEHIFVSETAFRDANPRRKQEGKKAYEARILSQYQSIRSDYNAAQAKYNAELAEYKKQKSAAKKHNIAYKKYQDSLEIAWFSLYKEHYTLFGATANQHHNANESMIQAIQNIRILTNYRNYKFNIGSDSLRPEFHAIRQSLAEYYLLINSLDTAKLNRQLVELNAIHCNSVAYKMTNQPLLKQYNSEQKQIAGFPPTSSSSNISFETALRIISKDTTISLSAFTANYIDTFAHKIINRSYFDEEIAFQASIRSINFEKLTEIGMQLQRLETNIRMSYRAKKQELGEMTDEELIMELSGNLAKITNLGWINCDRFLNLPPSECEKITIQCPNNANTQFFIIVPSLSSVLNLQPLSGKFVSPYNGIPKNLNLKLVALRVEYGTISIFTKEGNTAQINNCTLDFQPCSANKLSNILASL